MAQVLPADESFAAPDWSINTVATGHPSPPWYYWYVGLEVTSNFSTTAADASSGALYPMRPTGAMPGKGTSALLRPHPQALTSLPCLMTDTNGPTYDNTLRSVLCREEAAFDHNDQNITVVFGMEVAGGATEGFAHSGTNGSSPTPGGRFRYPPSPPTTGALHLGMGPGTRGGWSTGGPMNAMGSDDSPINPWPAWQGNAVYFRSGKGDCYVTNGATELPHTDADDVKRLWYYSAVDGYVFVAYPDTVGGGSTTNPDLYVEVWCLEFLDQGGTGNNARLLIKQTCNGCVDRIDFRQPFRMRVEVDEFSGSPTVKAWIGPYTDADGVVQPEVQCFKDDVLDTTNTYQLGASVLHTTSTGLVIDTHADKITDTAERTIGFGTATDLALDVSLALDAAATEPVIWQVHTGVYSIETKDIPDDPDDPDTVRYRDEFSRIVESGTISGDTAIVNPILSSVTGVEGVQLNGMFTFDGFAQQYPVTPSTADLNLGMIRRKMFWTTPPASGSTPSASSPNDYVTLDPNPDNHALNRPYYVTRSFVHLRPATQQYNHHRKLEFKPGAEAGTVGTITYELGIHLRGYFDGYTTNGLGCWLSYTTNGAGTITAATVTVGYREHRYSEQNPDNVTGSTHVVARKTWDDPIPDGFPNLFDGTWHSLDFQAVAYAEAPSPDTIGLYNVEIGGTKIELDDPTAPYQSGTSTPYTIVEPGPRVQQGVAEGFWFLASVAEIDATAGRTYSPPIVRNWTEEALVVDPGPAFTDTDEMASIPVSGEGTPVGELNTSTGALSITGGGVWDVDFEVQLEVDRPYRQVQFDSGHRYTSPMYSKSRRRWNVAVRNMDLAVYQALLEFYNSHNGIEVPFTFVVPIPDDGNEVGHTAEATESVYGWFIDDQLSAVQKTFQLYDVEFGVEELLIT